MRSLIFAVCVGLSLLACEVAMGSSAVGGEVVFSVTLNAAVPPEMQRVGDGYTEHVDKGCLKAEIDPQRTLLCEGDLLGGQAHTLLSPADFDGATGTDPILRASRIFGVEGVVFSRIDPWGNRVTFQRRSVDADKHAKSEIARGRLPVVSNLKVHKDARIAALHHHRYVLNGEVGANLRLADATSSRNGVTSEGDGGEKTDEANHAEPYLKVGGLGHLRGLLSGTPLLAKIGLYSILGSLAYGLIGLGAAFERPKIWMVGVGGAILLALIAVILVGTGP